MLVDGRRKDLVETGRLGPSLAQADVLSSCQTARSTPLDLVVPHTVGCHGYLVLVF